LLRADRLLAGRDVANLVSVGENAEEGDAVVDMGEEGVVSVEGAELFPDRPKVVTGVGVGGSQAALGRFFSNAECTAESITGRTCTIRQVCFCG